MKRNELPKMSAKCAFWQEGEVAERLGVSVQFLRKQRYAGEGIPVRRFGRTVRYAILDVLDYELASIEAFPGAMTNTYSENTNFENKGVK